MSAQDTVHAGRFVVQDFHKSPTAASMLGVSPGFPCKTVLNSQDSEPSGSTGLVAKLDLCMPERFVVRGLHVTPTHPSVLGSVPDSRVKAFSILKIPNRPAAQPPCPPCSVPPERFVVRDLHKSANRRVGARVSPGFPCKTVLTSGKSKPPGSTAYVQHVLCMPERLVVPDFR
jgi:hypothetical protein